MKISTLTLTLTGYLGQDVEIPTTTPRDYSRAFHDPVTDGEVVIEGTTAQRDYAKLSMAVHEGSGSDRATRWVQLRAWDLDHHPHEARLRTARKGQRVEVEGFEEIHRYTDRTGQESEFRYIVVTSFRFRPGRLLTPRLQPALA
jgi:single-stranded DNA-binding protein